MVVTAAPSACTARTVHDFTDSPSRWTVHAPHDDVSQPMFVPVSPTCSRMYWTSNVRGSTSCVCGAPLTVMLISTDGPLRAEVLSPRHHGTSTRRPEKQ